MRASGTTAVPSSWRGNTASHAAAAGNIVQTRLLMPGVDDDTVDASRRQLELYRANADRCGEATGLHRHGQVLLRQGRSQEAMAAHHRTLELLAEGEQDFLRGGTHMRLSEAYLRVGQPEMALAHAEQALTVGVEVRHEHLAALSRCAVGDALAAMGKERDARSYWRRAVEDLRRLEFAHDAERVAERLSRRRDTEGAQNGRGAHAPARSAARSSST